MGGWRHFRCPNNCGLIREMDLGLQWQKSKTWRRGRRLGRKVIKKINKASSFSYKQKPQSPVVDLCVWTPICVEGKGQQPVSLRAAVVPWSEDGCQCVQESRAGSGLWPICSLWQQKVQGLSRSACREIHFIDYQNLGYHQPSSNEAWTHTMCF